MRRGIEAVTLKTNRQLPGYDLLPPFLITNKSTELQFCNSFDTGTQMENSYGIIYRARNLVNGKVYIGQTTLKFKYRINIHRTTDDGSYFHNALKKYGFENFEWEILLLSKDKEELDFCECWVMDEIYESRNNQKGYNLRSGGANGLHSELTKLKLSKTSKGHTKESAAKAVETKRKNGTLTRSEEARRRQSRSMTGKKQTKEALEKRKLKLIGQKRSEEQKENIRRSNFLNTEKKKIKYKKKLEGLKPIILSFLEQGLKSEDIAKRMGIGNRTLCEYKKRLGLSSLTRKILVDKGDKK